MHIKAVTFFGSSKGNTGEIDFKNARACAQIVASSGRKVVNGGGPGIMLAATLGAKDVGGQTTVVYYEPELATMFEGKTAINFADTEYKEANYVNRTQKLLELGDLYIIFNGGTGTISEFGMAWGLARLYFGHHKPLILFGEFWFDLIESFKKNMKIRPEEFEVYRIIVKPEELRGVLDEFDEIVGKNRHEHTISATSRESFLLL